MTDPTDRIYERLLVLRCQVGDEAAFAEIVQRYDRRLRYYLRRMVSDRELLSVEAIAGHGGQLANNVLGRVEQELTETRPKK